MNITTLNDIYRGLLTSIDTDCKEDKRDFSQEFPSTYVALIALGTEIRRQVMMDTAAVRPQGKGETKCQGS